MGVHEARQHLWITEMTEHSYIAEGRTLPIYPGGTEELWQRREMVVSYLHEPGCEYCDGLRRQLEDDAHELTARDASLVEPDERHGELIARAFDIPAGDAAVGVADRFGRLFAVIDAHDAPAAQVVAEVTGWLDYIQSQCEECGAPVW